MVDLAYVIAGSEATGGAGLQVDLKTFQALDVYGVATTTCIVSFDPKNNWGHRFVPIAPAIRGELRPVPGSIPQRIPATDRTGHAAPGATFAHSLFHLLLQ